MIHSQVVEDLASEYGDFINVVMYVVDDAQASSSELKTEFKSTKLPLFRYFPNQKEGDAKRQASFNIVLPSEAYDSEFQEQIGVAITEQISQEI